MNVKRFQTNFSHHDRTVKNSDTAEFYEQRVSKEFVPRLIKSHWWFIDAASVM